MELDALQTQLGHLAQQASINFQKVPGSAVLVRYIRSSYQNDPVRSAIELVLVIFFIRYLLSPSYPTDKQNYVKLREDVRFGPCDACSCKVGNADSKNRRSTSWSMTGHPSRSS